MERIFNIFMNAAGGFVVCVIGWFLVNKLGFDLVLVGMLGGSLILNLLNIYLEGRK